MFSIKQFTTPIYRAFEGLVAPSICFNCDVFISFSDKKVLCEPCSESLALNRSPLCHHCGSSLTETTHCIGCDDLPRPWHITNAFYIFSYAGLAKKLILTYKISIADWVEPLFLEHLLRFFDRLDRLNIDVVTSVPNHGSSITNNNSSSYRFAKLIGKTMNIRCEALIIRSTKTKKQVALGRHDRRRSQLNTMIARPCIGNVLIVDDVFTTGSSLNESARALLQAGASKVHSLAIARGKT